MKKIILAIALLFIAACKQIEVTREVVIRDTVVSVKIDTLLLATKDTLIKMASPIVSDSGLANFRSDSLIAFYKIDAKKDTTTEVKFYPLTNLFAYKTKPDTVELTIHDTIPIRFRDTVKIAVSDTLKLDAKEREPPSFTEKYRIVLILFAISAILFAVSLIIKNLKGK